MELKHIIFAFILVSPATPAALVPSAEVQRTEALKKERLQLDAALARHFTKMKALGARARANPKTTP